jgi:uncharacterized phage protein gp47/JayE
MANVFRATRDIVQDMCADFKSITGITLTPDQLDDSNVIKFFAYAGSISSLYSELQRTVNDIFPSTATSEGLIKHLSTRSLPTQIRPQKSHGQIRFQGTPGTVVGLGVQVKRASDAALFQTIQSGTIDSIGFVTLYVESVSTGNIQNMDSIGNPFTLATPVSGLQSACTNVTNFLDGRDLETDSQMLQRIISHDQDDNSGGNAVAYEAWAQAGSNEVVTAKTIRLPRGPDTVDTYITSGTTDIQAAVEGGQPVTRQPSSALLAQVQAYITSLNPITDDHLTKAPVEIPLDVVFRFRLYNESVANRSYVGGIIAKIIKTYIYQARPLDVLSPSAIERLVDQRVGDQIAERYCDNLSGTASFYTVPSINILTPGTITISTL